MIALKHGEAHYSSSLPSFLPPSLVSRIPSSSSSSSSSKKKKGGKKKKNRQQEEEEEGDELVDGSHTGPVMALAWNQFHRQVRRPFLPPSLPPSISFSILPHSNRSCALPSLLLSLFPPPLRSWPPVPLMPPSSCGT